MSSRHSNQFQRLPANEVLSIAWPTANHFLLDAPEKFFARTRVNADYGKPGFTRDCGKRFHRGCDIAPVNVTATGKTTRVIFTDCATGADFESEEPTFVPQDDVFCVLDGRVAEVMEDESVSDFGKHLVVEHVWPGSGEKFFTIYAHLAEIVRQTGKERDERRPQAGTLAPPIDSLGGKTAGKKIWVGDLVMPGERIGKMGQTARSADARNWMAIAPHLHFEVRDVSGQSFDPVEFLMKFLPGWQM